MAVVPAHLTVGPNIRNMANANIGPIGAENIVVIGIVTATVVRAETDGEAIEEIAVVTEVVVSAQTEALETGALETGAATEGTEVIAVSGAKHRSPGWSKIRRPKAEDRKKPEIRIPESGPRLALFPAFVSCCSSGA